MSAPSVVPGPAPWWQMIWRGNRPVAVLVGLAPAGRLVLVWPSIDPRQANALVLGSLHDVSSMRLDAPAPAEPLTPRFYAVSRTTDRSGVSGTGLVAVAAEVRPLNAVVLAWIGQSTGVQSVTTYRSMDELRRIHGHDGATSLDEWPASSLRATRGSALGLPPSCDDERLLPDDVVPSPTLVPAGPVRPRLPHAAAAVSAGTGALDQASGGEPR